MDRSQVRTLIRMYAIELLIYSILVVGYFFLVLRLLAAPLYELFSTNLILYAFVALGLIIAQAVVLDAIATFIVRRSGLGAE